MACGLEPHRHANESVSDAQPTTLIASIPAREVVAGSDSHISTPPKLGADTEIWRKRGPALDARWNPNDPTRPPNLA